MKILVAMLAVLALCARCTSAVAAESTGPAWARALPAGTSQVVLVEAAGGSNAWVSIHERDESGEWVRIMGTYGFIGKRGLGKEREGDMRTPVGVFHFTRAFGIAENPGCAIPYVRVGPEHYWSGDVRPGMHYNEMVDIRDLPGLNRQASEHIIDYVPQYEYCLNISYNEDGTPGKGSAIFLHCTGTNEYTAGCVAIPKDKMRLVMQRVRSGCAVVIGSQKQIETGF